MESKGKRRVKGDIDAKISKIANGEKDKSFLPVLEQVLSAADAFNYAALKAEEIVETLHKRNLEAGEEYVDSAVFDLALYNLRAWLVLDMMTLRGMLKLAGLEAYVRPALLRLLDLRLKPIQDEPRIKLDIPPVIERRLVRIEEALNRKQSSSSEVYEPSPKRRKR